MSLNVNAAGTRIQTAKSGMLMPPVVETLTSRGR